MDLQSKFEEVIKEYDLRSQHTRLLVAVSGGLDSVVLATLCKRAGLNFSIAHCNFQLREAESERDEAFVTELAQKAGVQFYTRRFDTKKIAEENKLSVQETARKLRYDFFAELVQKEGFAFTLLAHHADDQVETVLMNFFRGTGLDGLAGMRMLHQEQAGSLRPLLQIRRSEILDFAKENKLQWMEDSSNQSNKYTRNFFRNELVPQLQNIYPATNENLLHNIERLQKTNALYKKLVADLIKKLGVPKGNELHFPVLKLMEYADTSLLFEITRTYGFSEKQAEEISKLLYADSGKYVANGQYQVIRHRNWIIISPVTVNAHTIAIDRDMHRISFEKGEIEICITRKEKFQLGKKPMLAQLDAKDIEWPLLLRRWRQGDYFYPLGMKKKKKISRFFIDQKLSKSDKENTWIIESNKKIIWVVGHRIDERFKVTEKTKEVLEIRLSIL